MIKVCSIENPVGKVWDYKGKSKVIQIFIGHNYYKVNFIQFLYDESGTLVLSEKLGGPAAEMFNVVNLDYPSEFITGIAGASGLNGRSSFISSIIITTNKRTYGPFGSQSPGQNQNYNIQMGKHSPFGGFHGSSFQNGSIESIGVYVKPIASLNNLKKPKKIKNEEV